MEAVNAVEGTGEPEVAVREERVGGRVAVTAVGARGARLVGAATGGSVGAGRAASREPG